MLPACLSLAAIVMVSASGIHRQSVDVPADLREPLAAVVRIATGMQANMACNRLSVDARNDMNQQLQQAVQTLHNRMVDGNVPARKSRQILTRLLDEGEKLGRNNYPTCTDTAPDIIVKAAQDAACINPYLAGSNTSCFR